MPAVNSAGLLRHLQGNPSAAVIFLHGEEEYLREAAVKAVVEQVVDPATRDFNLDQLRGSDVSAEALASMLATPPMMAQYRLVIVRDAQGLSVKARELLEQILPKPTPGVILLLVATIPSASKAKFYDVLKKQALSVEFAAVDPLDLPGWLVARAASEHALDLELDAARALAGAIGAQLGVLATELEKAAAYVGDRKQIVLADIKAVGGYIPRVDRWGWFDKVGERRFNEAFNDLPELLDSGENGVGLIIGLGSHLLKIGLMVAGGRQALERHLRPNQKWLANRLQTPARKWSAAEIDRAMEELLRADRLLKSASLTDRQAMEELLLRLSLGGPVPGRKTEGREFAGTR
jgi:DNA polymerase-3 subunit delta